MTRRLRYFPWRVARQLFFSHFVFVLVALVVTGFSLRYFVYRAFLNTGDVHQALANFDQYLTSLFVWVLGFSGVYLAFTARHYARPLGRLIQRARDLRRRRYRAEEEDVDAEELEEEPGEWSDLERAINRLHSDLRGKSEDLSREREELTALIGAVADAILAVDAHEVPRFYNPQLAMLFHLEQRAHKPHSLSEVFRIPEILQAYRDVLATGEPRVVTTTIQPVGTPMPRHFSVSIAPLTSGGGASEPPTDGSSEGRLVDGAIGIFHDVTELKQAEQIRIEFVANASHELRTPLTSIKGYVETLKEDLQSGRPDDVPRFLEIITKNTDRLIFLVNDLLDLSTLESGAELVRSMVSTRDVTEGALRQLEARRAGKRQNIETKFLAENVMADEQRLEQVIVNLVQNAIKYTPEGSRIEVTWEAGDRGAAVLRVKDNGPGVRAEHQGRLFERFYRVDPGRSRDQGGTGLGLSIVKHIMLKHGGSVRLESRPGAGAEFTCVFPGR